MQVLVRGIHIIVKRRTKYKIKKIELSSNSRSIKTEISSLIFYPQNCEECYTRTHSAPYSRKHLTYTLQFKELSVTMSKSGLLNLFGIAVGGGA